MNCRERSRLIGRRTATTALRRERLRAEQREQIGTEGGQGGGREVRPVADLPDAAG